MCSSVILISQCSLYLIACFECLDKETHLPRLSPIIDIRCNIEKLTKDGRNNSFLVREHLPFSIQLFPLLLQNTVFYAILAGIMIWTLRWLHASEQLLPNCALVSKLISNTLRTLKYCKTTFVD